jgi:hypothetical protein
MLQDLRYGLRMLAKSPGFTIIAALSLALGIGANTAIFSMVNVILLKPVPVQEPSHLASVLMLDQRNPGNLPLSHLNYKDLRDQNEVFSGMAAFAFAQLNWSGGSESEQIPAQVVSGNYFSLLGAEPALGRSFRPEEDEKPTPVAIVSHGFWERSLGSDPNIVGKRLTPMNFNLGREGYTPERGQVFYQQIAERAAALPGVQRSAVAQNAPLGGGLLRSVMPEGADTTTRDRILVPVNSVSPGYLDTLSVPLQRGRDFTATDVDGAPKAVIVTRIDPLIALRTE